MAEQEGASIVSNYRGVDGELGGQRDGVCRPGLKRPVYADRPCVCARAVLVLCDLYAWPQGPLRMHRQARVVWDWRPSKCPWASISVALAVPVGVC